MRATTSCANRSANRDLFAAVHEFQEPYRGGEEDEKESEEKCSLSGHRHSTWA